MIFYKWVMYRVMRILYSLAAIGAASGAVFYYRDYDSPSILVGLIAVSLVSLYMSHEASFYDNAFRWLMASEEDKEEDQ